MGKMDRKQGMRQYAGTTVQLLAAAMVCAGLSGCVVIGGTSRGGFFLFPGGLGLIVLILLFVFLTRRR